MTSLEPKQHLRILAGILLAASASAAGKTGMTVKVVKGNVAEDQDRLIDQVALTAEEESIRRLERLLQKYRGTSHEPALLAKLAELYQEEGGLRFRVAHGRAAKMGAAINLADYKKSMKSSVDALNQLIGRYPDYDELDLAFFMRAKAYQEIPDKSNAKKDFLTLVKRFPNAPECVSAYMALADYAVEDNRHEEALSYLAFVERKPESPQYPFALYKMAWSHYNLKNIPRALSYLERHVAYYKKPRAEDDEDVVSSSDQAIRENSLMDMAMFYFEGIENKLSDYSLSKALAYFKEQDPGELLGHMTVRLAKHLRAADMQDELIAWKNELIEKEAARPETMEVAMLLFEDQLNKHKLQSLGATARDFVRIYHAAPNSKSLETYTKAQKMLLDTAEQLQAVAVKNKKADDLKTVTTTLSALYSAFIDTVSAKDERVPRVHYNLAETLFAIQDFPGATEHYRWVVENWNNQKTFDLKVASLKAIASRYEVLRASGLIPTDLAARPLSQNGTGDAEPKIEEWIRWIDQHAARYSKPDDSFDNFQFEADRALYSQGKIQRAVERFLDFSENHPQSKFSIPAASVIIDTYVAGQDWEKTNQVANRLLRVKAWGKTPFEDRLLALAADSFYKTAEIQNQNGDYKGTLAKSEDCIEQYAKSKRLVDCLLLAGKASLKLGREEEAEAYFTKLVQEHAASEPASVALLERAQIREKNFQFAGAAADFQSYIRTDDGKKLGAERTAELWKSTLQLLWLSGETQPLLALVKSLPLCRDESLLDTCTRYEALSLAESPATDGYKEALVRVMHGHKDQRAIWALAALKQMEQASYNDRLFLIKSVADHWDKLDALSQYALLDDMNRVLPKAFALSRQQMPSQSPLRATPKSIKRRVEFIQELEGVATAVMKLPWARVRAEFLNQVADLYSDFATAVRGLPAPEGLPESEKSAYDESLQKIVFPFEEKGSDLRRKAFEVASSFAVDTATFSGIAEAFFKENPSQAKQMEMPGDFKKPVEFDEDFMTSVSRQGYWKRVRSVRVAEVRITPDNRARAVQAQWIHNLDRKNWAAAAYFLTEAQSKNEKAPLPRSVVAVMKAYSLAAAGARSEAFEELYDQRSLFSGSEIGALMGGLVAAHIATLSKDKVKEIIQTAEKESDQGILVPLVSDRKDAWAFVYGADWSGAKLSEQNRIDLFEEAAHAPGRERSEWARAKLDQLQAERKLASKGD